MYMYLKHHLVLTYTVQTLGSLPPAAAFMRKLQLEEVE